MNENIGKNDRIRVLGACTSTVTLNISQNVSAVATHMPARRTGEYFSRCTWKIARVSTIKKYFFGKRGSNHYNVKRQRRPCPHDIWRRNCI